MLSCPRLIHLHMRCLSSRCSGAETVGSGAPPWPGQGVCCAVLGFHMVGRDSELVFGVGGPEGESRKEVASSPGRSSHSAYFNVTRRLATCIFQTWISTTDDCPQPNLRSSNTATVCARGCGGSSRNGVLVHVADNKALCVCLACSFCDTQPQLDGHDRSVRRSCICYRP